MILSNISISQVPIDEPYPAFDPFEPLYNPKNNIQVVPLPKEFAYPDIATLNCANVQQEIDKVTEYGMTRKVKQLDSWFVEANKIKDACAANGANTTSKLSKNLTPYVLLLGVAVGAIILTKILKK